MSNSKRLDDFEPEQLSVAAQRTFSNIVDAWELEQLEAMRLLGFDDTTKSAYFK